ncbi:hypothetical protein ALC56_10899, partial [Trachymyrmex septentrionalis]
SAKVESAAFYVRIPSYTMTAIQRYGDIVIHFDNLHGFYAQGLKPKRGTKDQIRRANAAQRRGNVGSHTYTTNMRAQLEFCALCPTITRSRCDGALARVVRVACVFISGKGGRSVCCATGKFLEVVRNLPVDAITLTNFVRLINSWCRISS